MSTDTIPSSDHNNHKPFVDLEKNGTPTSINYNVPEPSVLNGRSFIELEFDEEIFSDDIINFISSSSESQAARMKFGYSIGDITNSMINGFNDPNIFPNIGIYAGLVRLIRVDPIKEDYKIISNFPVSNELINLHPIDVHAALSRGKSLVIFKSKQGLLTYDFINTYMKANDENVFLFKKHDWLYQQIGKRKKLIARPDPYVTPGDIGIDQPKDGQLIKGKAPAGVQIAVNGSASYRELYVHGETKGFQKPDKIWITVNGQDYAPTVTDQPLLQVLFDKTLPPITNSGTYEITATAHYPQSGDFYEDQPYHKITVTVSLEDPDPTDKTPPELKIISPANNSIIVTTGAQTTLSLFGTASDSGSGVASVLVDIGDGYNPAIPSVPNDWSYWSFQGSTSLQGPLKLTAQAKDKSGNTTEDSVSIIIKQEVSKPKRLRMYLVESYRLSSYLGQYGAGRVVKTFSLLPGEKSKISVKTFTKSRTEAKQSSSILDSVTDESTKDFETSLAQEQSDKANYQKTFSYEINARAEASWGWGKASVSGDVKGGTSNARETFGKNLMNTTQKHASKASSKRDITVNTSYEKSTEEGEETSFEREIQNINLGRTLNFVFRQMNQEILTILHLVDARIAVWDGDPNPDTSIHKEYSLPELDNLFTDFIKDSDNIKNKIRNVIKNELGYIFDYLGDKPIEDFIEEKETTPGRKYLRIKPRITPFEVKQTGTKLDIPGIIISSDYNVMRTEGILVEALLGQSNALDDYSSRLQVAAVTLKELENEQNRVERARKQLAIDIVNSGNNKKAQLFQKVYPCCKPTIFSLWPPKDNEKHDGGVTA